jgi:hypothetical protein
MRYRFTTPHYGKIKQWQAEFIGNDANRTSGLIDIWAEHMRIIKSALPGFTPHTSPDWQPFPQPMESVLHIDPHGRLRIQSIALPVSV